MLLPHDGEYMASDEIVRSSVWTNSFSDRRCSRKRQCRGFTPDPRIFRFRAVMLIRQTGPLIGPGPSRPPAQRSGCVPAEPYPLAGSGKVYLFMLTLRDSRSQKNKNFALTEAGAFIHDVSPLHPMRQHRFRVTAGNHDFHPQSRLEDVPPMLLLTIAVEGRKPAIHSAQPSVIPFSLESRNG